MEERISSVLKVPTVSIAALKGKAGAKIKDMEATTGASIQIFNPEEGNMVAEVNVTGTKHAVETAFLLIKISVLHTRAAAQTARPTLYVGDKAAEAKINVATFHREMTDTAFSTRLPMKPQICEQN